MKLIPKLLLSFFFLLFYGLFNSSCSSSHVESKNEFKQLLIDSISQVKFEFINFNVKDTILINNLPQINYKRDTITINFDQKSIFKNDVYHYINNFIAIMDSNNYNPIESEYSGIYYNHYNLKSETDTINNNLFNNEFKLYYRDTNYYCNVKLYFINKFNENIIKLEFIGSSIELKVEGPVIVIEEAISPQIVQDIVISIARNLPIRQYSNYYSDIYNLPRFKFEKITKTFITNIIKEYNNYYQKNIDTNVSEKIIWYEK